MLMFTSGVALAETKDELVEREGLMYKKFTDVPFTGKVTGQRQGRIKNGEREGPWVYYHDNGQLMHKGDYKNGEKEGPWVCYHDNGQLSDKGDHKNGEKEGPWITYHDNGHIWKKGDYKNGEREGPWVYYNKNGTIDERHTGIFKNGVKIGD